MPHSLFQFPELRQNRQIVHFFTQKPYNFHPDLPHSEISKQLNKIFAQINYHPKAFYHGNQSHSANIQIITQSNLKTFDPSDTDGLITNLPGIALSTYTADCQAILIYDPVRHVIANIHSGWRGTLQKIVQSAITKMQQTFHSRPEDLQVYICPSIQKCCFEIGPEVVQKFKAEFPNITKYLYPSPKNSEQKSYFDTVQLNINLLKSCGVNENNIITSNICTKCHPNTYHSYRTNGKSSGRNLAFFSLVG